MRLLEKARQQAVLDSLLVELQRVKTSDPPGFLRDAAIEALLVQIDRVNPEDQAQRRTEADTELDVNVPVPLISGRNHGPQRNSTANK